LPLQQQQQGFNATHGWQRPAGPALSNAGFAAAHDLNVSHGCAGSAVGSTGVGSMTGHSSCGFGAASSGGHLPSGFGASAGPSVCEGYVAGAGGGAGGRCQDEVPKVQEWDSGCQLGQHVPDPSLRAPAAGIALLAFVLNM
jgi:hypothetical protein